MPYKYKDFYFKKAKKEKYPARSVYKLKEADKKYRFLRPGQIVLDLGAAPGSWSKYVLEKIGPKGLLIGVDISPINLSAPNFTFLQRDIFQLEPEEILSFTGGKKFDVILSDMAPKTTGDRSGDHFRSIILAQRALEFAERLLRFGGVFLVKAFEGETFPTFVEEVRKRLGQPKRFRPKSTRPSSREIYLFTVRK